MCLYDEAFNKVKEWLYNRENKYRCYVALIPWNLHAELDFVPVDRDASGVHKTIRIAYVTIL